MNTKAMRLDRREFCAALGATLLLPPKLIFSQSEVFAARTYQNSRGQSLPYRLFVPQAYDKRRSYPLVLWLHGGAGRGVDNLKQISLGNVLGTHVWTTLEQQAKNPCLVVAPQCPENLAWASVDRAQPTAALRLALELLEDLQRTFSIDRRGLYVSGQSLGGFGAWSAITAHPELFAAAIPLCGGGDELHAPKLTRLPIWAFHGAMDDLVNVERSRKMIDAISRAGGRPKYTEYKDLGHAIWDRAFNEPELLPWVFAQKRSV